jgi:hypothetical protein
LYPTAGSTGKNILLPVVLVARIHTVIHFIGLGRRGLSNPKCKIYTLDLDADWPNLAKNESCKNGFVSDPKNPNENPKQNPDFLGCTSALRQARCIYGIKM